MITARSGAVEDVKDTCPIERHTHAAAAAGAHGRRRRRRRRVERRAIISRLRQVDRAMVLAGLVAERVPRNGYVPSAIGRDRASINALRVSRDDALWVEFQP